MESVCTGWHDVCLGKVLGVRREMISMALHPTLLLPPPPSVVNAPKRFFSFLNLGSLNHKLQSTQRPIKESIQAPVGLDLEESQKAKEKQNFGFLMTVRKYKQAGQSGEDERPEALLMNEAE